MLTINPSDLVWLPVSILFCPKSTLIVLELNDCLYRLLVLINVNLLLVLENEYRFFSICNQPKAIFINCKMFGTKYRVVLEIQIGIVHFYFAACINNNFCSKEDSKTLTKTIEELLSLRNGSIL
jgi:hypothetical protein